MPPAYDRVPTQGESTFRGCTINYLRWGEPLADHTLVLVHGGGANAWWWSDIAPQLVIEHQSVVAMDLSGHGDSGHRDQYSLDTWADEVNHVAKIVSGSGAYSLVGHSMGGVVTLVASASSRRGLVGTVAIDSRVVDQKTWAGKEAAQRMRDVPHRSYADEDEAIEHFRLVPTQPLPSSTMLRRVVQKSITTTDAGKLTWKFDPHVFTRHRPHPDKFARVLASIDSHVALIFGEKSEVRIAAVPYFRSSLTVHPTVVQVPEAYHHLMFDQPIALVSILRTLTGLWEAA